MHLTVTFFPKRSLAITSIIWSRAGVIQVTARKIQIGADSQCSLPVMLEIFSVSPRNWLVEIIISTGKNFYSHPRKLIRSLIVRGSGWKNILIMFLAIEDQLIDDPRNIIYDSLYFELKDLLRYYSWCSYCFNCLIHLHHV